MFLSKLLGTQIIKYFCNFDSIYIQSKLAREFVVYVRTKMCIYNRFDVIYYLITRAFTFDGKVLLATAVAFAIGSHERYDFTKLLHLPKCIWCYCKQYYAYTRQHNLFTRCVLFRQITYEKFSLNKFVFFKCYDNMLPFSNEYEILIKYSISDHLVGIC